MRIPKDKELLAGIRAWVEVETPTGHAPGLNHLMDMVGEAFTELGAAVERTPGREGQGDHLLCRLPWRGAIPGDDVPGLLILSHLDTVHAVGTLDVLPFRVEGDHAYGPGTSDMKGGAYIAYRAIRTLVEAEHETPLPVRYLFTSDEETGSETSRDLIEAAAEHAKYVLVTEPARGGGKIVTGRRGVGRYGLSAKGRAAHAGTNHAAGRSAIRELARKVLEIEGKTDYERGVTFNIGRIWGGTTDNTVPEEAGMRIDLRFTDPADGPAMDAWLRSLTPDEPDVEIALTGSLNRPAYTKTNAIASLFEHAKGLAAEAGWVLEDMHTGGGSDGSFVAARVSTLDGLGVDGADAHTLNEHLYVSSLQPRMALMRRLLETLE
ncbi:MAG: M20 family metallopeptidase [Pseudomonadota bacterium]